MEQIKHDYSIDPRETIYFTSYDWHDEDHQTVQFLRSYCLDQSTDYIGIQDIVVADDGIYTKMVNEFIIYIDYIQLNI